METSETGSSSKQTMHVITPAASKSNNTEWLHLRTQEGRMDHLSVCNERVERRCLTILAAGLVCESVLWLIRQRNTGLAHRPNAVFLVGADCSCRVTAVESKESQSLPVS